MDEEVFTRDEAAAFLKVDKGDYCPVDKVRLLPGQAPEKST